jgi:hypothetical protein
MILEDVTVRWQLGGFILKYYVAAITWLDASDSVTALPATVSQRDPPVPGIADAHLGILRPTSCFARTYRLTVASTRVSVSDHAGLRVADAPCFVIASARESSGKSAGLADALEADSRIAVGRFMYL